MLDLKCSEIDIHVTESMVKVNRATSAPNYVLQYDVDKGQNFVLEFKFTLLAKPVV